jgi:polysaccharide biosynthesis/export protein
MRYRTIQTLIILFVLAAGLRAQVPEADPSKGYLIGPGDEITAKVLGEPQFDFVATVDHDGRIEVPFIDKPVAAVCKSERDLRQDVSSLLSKYLKNPQVSIRVTQRNSRPPVSIFGEVREQKQIILTRRAYLLELVSFVGGETEKSGGLIQVFRPRPPMCGEGTPSDKWTAAADSGLGVPSKIFSLASLRQGRGESNPEIFPGDVIVVPKAAAVYVTGEVRKPGEVGIPEDGLPLTQAIALASGITREAKTKNIKIYRRKPGNPQPEIIAVNYDQIKKGTASDVMLMPFDIVEVDKAPKKFTDYLIEFATGIPNRIPITY